MEKKILIIEDNEQNMYLLTFLLEKNGYPVLQAKNGMDGLRLAAAEKPDLILLDIQLPGINGYEVARRLKTADETRPIPVIAVTSYAMKGDRELALSSGCDGYIEKPLDPETFLDSISRFL